MSLYLTCCLITDYPAQRTVIWEHCHAYRCSAALLVTSSGAGGKAVASSVSVGEVRRPPIIASAPLLCMDVNWLITLVIPLCHWSLAFGGAHQTSIAYSVLGIATLMQSPLRTLALFPKLV